MRNDDARGKKIAFVSSCLLNANNKVMGLARYPGMCKEVIDILYEFGFGVMQMPCPETLYMGVDRWWCVKDLYDNPGFRNHCRALAKQMVDYMENYFNVAYSVPLILSCNGSPTCGVDLTSRSQTWGGKPERLDYNETLVSGRGVFIEELCGEIKLRDIISPRLYGLDLDDEGKTTESIMSKFREFIDAWS